MPTNYTPISQLPMTLGEVFKPKAKPKPKPKSYIKYQGSPHVFEKATGRYIPYAEAQAGNIWGQIEDAPEAMPAEYQAKVPSGWDKSAQSEPAEKKPVSYDDFVSQYGAVKGTTVEPETSVAGGAYDIPKLQTDIETTKSQLESAQGALTGYQTKRYEEEYSSKGLTDIKDKIAKIDSQIADEKDVRDVSISKVRRNPYYSAATITGEVSEMERLANAKINNLINQRNGLADSYNTTLDEVTKKIAMETTDKQQEVKNMQYNLSWLTNQLAAYQGIRSEELARGTEQERWEMDFARRLTEAEEAGKRWEAEQKLDWYKAQQEEGGGGYKPPTSYQEWQLAGGEAGTGMTYMKWLTAKEEGRTPTQERAADREKKLLSDYIGKYKETWAKEGDEGAGTREEFVIEMIGKLGGLTPEEVSNAVYTEVPDEWLTANEPKSWWARLWGK